MANIEDIVNKAGVSRSTVFRFLNGNNVRESSKNLILGAMKELNYRTEEFNKHNNFVIEISIPHNYDEFQGFLQIVQGIMESAEELRVAVHLVRRVGNQIDEDYSKWDTKGQTKGVLIIGKNKADELKESELLTEKKIPHMLINRELIDKQISYVSVDFESVTYDLVKYLINKGHRKILMIGNTDELLLDEKKIAGYKRALKDSGITIDYKWICKYSSPDEWERSVKQILLSGDIPHAFLGICDSHCVAFMNIARAMGYDIPNDISVISTDGTDITKYSFPALTTAVVPYKQMGIVAVKQMVHLFNGKYKSSKILLDYEIAERDSVSERS